MATNYYEYSTAYYEHTIADGDDGESWGSLANALGENVTLAAYASSSNSKPSFSTHSVDFTFSYLDIATHLDSNATTAVLKFIVRYEISRSDSNADVFCSIFPSTTKGDLSFQTKNGVASLSNGNLDSVQTAEISVCISNIPSNDTLAGSEFGFSFFFECSNASEINVEVRIYDVQIQILSGTGTSYTLMAKEQNGILTEFYENGDTFYLPFISENQIGSFQISIVNAGTEPLLIPLGSISADTNGLSLLSYPYPDTDISLDFEKSVNIQGTYSRNKAGSFASQLFLNSITDDALSAFSAFAAFTVETFSQISDDVNLIPAGPDIGGGDQDPIPSLPSFMVVSYNSNSIANNNTLSLSSFPVDVQRIVSVNVSNLLIELDMVQNSITISNITIRGDGNIGSNSMGAGTVLIAGQSSVINLVLSTSSIGNKEVFVDIYSNAQNAPLFSFSLTYAILEQYSIEFKSDGVVLEDSQENDLGVVDRSREIIKNFTLQNSGIYKTIIVNSISVTHEEMTLIGVPSLPVTLLPNNANSISFSMSLSTDVVGLKEGNVVIDYSEGTTV